MTTDEKIDQLIMMTEALVHSSRNLQELQLACYKAETEARKHQEQARAEDVVDRYMLVALRGSYKDKGIHDPQPETEAIRQSAFVTAAVTKCLEVRDGIIKERNAGTCQGCRWYRVGVCVQGSKDHDVAIDFACKQWEPTNET